MSSVVPSLFAVKDTTLYFQEFELHCHFTYNQQFIDPINIRSLDIHTHFVCSVANIFVRFLFNFLRNKHKKTFQKNSPLEVFGLLQTNVPEMKLPFDLSVSTCLVSFVHLCTILFNIAKMEDKAEKNVSNVQNMVITP